MKTIEVEFALGDRVRGITGRASGLTGQVVGADLRVSGNTYRVRWDYKPSKLPQLMTELAPDHLEPTK